MQSIEEIMPCPLFKGIRPSRLEEILGQVFHKTRHFKKGDIISHAGNTCDVLMIMLEGIVSGEMSDFTGKTLKIEDIEAPRPLAPAYLFGMNNQFPVTIVAQSNVRLEVFPKESVIKMMQIDELLLGNYLDIISNRAQFLSQKIKFLTFKTIREKIAHFLLLHSKTGKMEVQFGQTHQQLADLFGVTRPSLTRAILDMEEERIIESNRGTIKIINIKMLNEIVNK